MLKNILAAIFSIIKVNSSKMTKKYDKSFIVLHMIHVLYFMFEPI